MSGLYYKDEFVKIYHGDAREIISSLPKVDLVLTDPPYGIGKDGQKFSTGGHGGRKAYEFLGWDSLRPEAEVFTEILARSDNQIIWGGNYFADLLSASSGWIVWDKGQRINQSDGELAWTSFDCALRIFTFNRVELMTDGAVHPTQKPLRLLNRCIDFADKQATKAIKTILDPFCGSGSTLRAAKNLGRKAVGIEVNEAYCEIAAKRCNEAQPSMYHLIEAKERQGALIDD
jgi:DNA modification methylase